MSHSNLLQRGERSGERTAADVLKQGEKTTSPPQKTSKDPATQVHWFSRLAARKHSLNEAILLNFLNFKVLHSRNIRDGRQWYYDSVAAIASRFPYLTAEEVRGALDRAAKRGLLTIGNYNKLAADKTRWYTLTPTALSSSTGLNKELIGFFVVHAVQHDVESAVLIYHLDRINQTRSSGRQVPDITISGIARYLPLSRSTVKRRLEYLRSQGLISF